MKENVIKEKNVKIPLYVTVYETISEWLKEGNISREISFQAKIYWQNS